MHGIHVGVVQNNGGSVVEDVKSLITDEVSIGLKSRFYKTATGEAAGVAISDGSEFCWAVERKTERRTRTLRWMCAGVRIE